LIPRAAVRQWRAWTVSLPPPWQSRDDRAHFVRLSGRLAWLLWGAVHVFFLMGFRNRIAVLLNWLWAYFTFERGSRLITSTAAEEWEMALLDIVALLDATSIYREPSFPQHTMHRVMSFTPSRSITKHRQLDRDVLSEVAGAFPIRDWKPDFWAGFPNAPNKVRSVFGRKIAVDLKANADEIVRGGDLFPSSRDIALACEAASVGDPASRLGLQLAISALPCFRDRPFGNSSTSIQIFHSSGNKRSSLTILLATEISPFDVFRTRSIMCSAARQCATPVYDHHIDIRRGPHEIDA
jgi:hypothetical protein